VVASGKSAVKMQSYILLPLDFCVWVCVCVCPGITLKRLERFQPNLVHILLYVCLRFFVSFIYIPQGGWCGRQGIGMIHIVEEIKLLPGNRLKHIRGNVRYLMTCNVNEFTVGYSNQ
jgi:hypothetical protein